MGRLAGIYILIIPPPGGGEFLSKLKTGKNLKDMKPGRKRGGKKKKEKSDKTQVKIPL